MRAAVPMLVVIAALVAGCGADDENGGGSKTMEPPADIVAALPGRPLFKEDQPPGTYVGSTGEDGRHSVAVVVQRDVAVVYVCDGEKFGDWFAGPVKDGGFDLRSGKGTHIRGAAQRAGVAGTLQVEGGEEVAWAAVAPSEKRPRTGFFVFDDPDAQGYTARWIVSEDGMRGLSSQPTGAAVTHGVTIRRATASSTTDARFAGVSSDIDKLMSDVNGLKSELNAARNESTSLRDLLAQQAQQQQSTTTTSTTTTTTTQPPPTAKPPSAKPR